MVECRRLRRGAAIVMAAGLAVVVLAVVLGAMALAAPSDFLHIRTNISQTSTLDSAGPDLAVSPDGKRVAVVWTEEYRSGIGYRGHVYLRAASETGGGWGSTIPVFVGSDAACACDAAVAITGTTAHVAYVVFTGTCFYPTQMLVRYRTCSLTTGQCDSPADGYGVAAVDTGQNRITWVDLALDAAGNPHVVWPRYDKDGSHGRIYYRRAFTDTHWSTGELIGPDKDSDMPAIAWADGYVHVVWQVQQGNSSSIMYRRGSESGWDSPLDMWTMQSGLLQSNPDVAARAGRVFVVWDWCVERDSSTAPCKRYWLVYRRSNDKGSELSWGLSSKTTYEVGTDRLWSTPGLVQYDSTSDKIIGGDYLVDLQPSIALNRDGWPAVVWQADHGNEGGDMNYAIYYSVAITGTADTVDWITTTTVLSQSQPVVAGSPAVGIGQPAPGGEQHLHVAYMRQLSANNWDVYYDSNEADRYKYVYLPVIMRVH